MIAALVFLALQGSGPERTGPEGTGPEGTNQRAPEHGTGAGPRSAVAGMAGFQYISSIAPEGAEPGAAQGRLTVVYMFPDRVRWHYESSDADGRVLHQFFYRLGQEVHAFGSGSPSTVLGDEQRDALLLQMELRRAALNWPDGFRWTDGAETRTADLHRDSCCSEGLIGTLVAHLEDGRLARVEARDTQGRTLESVGIPAWQERAGRRWPSSMLFTSEGSTFVETIESIETRVHYLELSFMAPDRRPRRSVAAAAGVHARDLISVSYAEHELPEGVAWEQATALAHGFISVAREALAAEGLAVDSVPTFELSAEGRPVRCLVRLAVARRPPPAGFQTVAERPGLLMPLNNLGQLGAPTLERLEGFVPPGASPGTPYVRIHPRTQLRVELVMPLIPID